MNVTDQLSVAFQNNPFLVGVPEECVTEKPRLWEVDDRTYHGDVRCESSSTIGMFLKSPWEYYQTRVLKQGQRKYSPAMSIGTALHHKILTPDLFFEEVRTLPQTAKAKASVEMIEREPGFCWLEPGGMEKVFRMESILKAAREAAAFDGSDAEWVYAALFGEAEHEAEIAFRMRHPESGVGLKCKCDMLVYMGDELWQIDLKTSRHPDPLGFASSFRQYGYHRQASIYRYILHHVYPEVKRIRVLYVAVSNTDRPESYVYQLDDAAVSAGFYEVSEALKMIRELVDKDSEEAWRTAEPPKFNHSFQSSVMRGNHASARDLAQVREASAASVPCQ